MGEVGHRGFFKSGPPAGAVAIGNVRDLYDDWLNIQPNSYGRLDDYNTENLLLFPGGWVEVRRYSWSRPVSVSWGTSDHSYIIGMSLSSQGEPSAAQTIGAAKHLDPENLGRVYMIPPDQVLNAHVDLEGNSRTIRCVLDSTLVDSLLMTKPAWNWDQSLLHESLNLDGGQIEWTLRRMYREMQEPDFATPTMIETLAKQLGAEIIRKFQLRSASPGYHVGGLAPWRMRLIRQRVYAERPPPNLQELADLCDMTVRHLSRAFRTETGQTIGKYIEAVMVERATAMLTAGQPVCDVASAVGYSTSGSFACAYRRATGLLPSEVNAIRKH